MAIELYVSPELRAADPSELTVKDLEQVLSGLINHSNDHPYAAATVRLMRSGEGGLRVTYHCSLYKPLNMPEGS